MSADTVTAPSAPAREHPPTPVPSLWRALWALPATRVGVVGALLVMFLVSVWLRTRSLHMYFWVDEGISVGIASHPLAHIPALMRQDGSPPLYYLLLHAWMSIFGRSEVASHEFSLVFSLLTIPVAYWAGASLFDRRTGLVCAVIAAGVPYFTQYAQETRMYSMMALLSLIIAASFVHSFVRHRRRYLPLFSVSLAAGVYTHNWALFMGLICGVGFLWCLRAQPAQQRVLWRDGLVAFGAVVVLFAPWLPTLAFQAKHTGAPWDLKPVVWSLSQGAYSLVGGRGAAIALLLAGGVGLYSLRVVTGAPPAPSPAGRAPAGGGAVARLRAILALPEAGVPWPRLAAECLFILGAGTLLVAWAYSKINPAWANRYLAVVVGPLLLLFGLGLARAGRLGLVALALVVCFWILDPVPHKLNSKSNVASVAASVRRDLGSDPLVLSTQPEQVPVLAYYLPSVRHFATPLGPVADPRVVDWRDALARLKRSSVHGVLAPMVARLKPGQRVLLVTPVKLPKQPEWMVLVNQANVRWGYFLARDPHLRWVTSSDAKSNASGVAVQATLYERR